MKYKRLNTAELKELEPEFINFLSSAQITAVDWERMKKDEPAKTEELVDVFSDVVYGKVMSKIQYLEFRDPKTLSVFFCKEDKIVLAGLKVSENSSLDLSSEDIFSQWNESNLKEVTVIRTEKEYGKERGLEVFELLQNGCMITDRTLFDLINSMFL